MKLSGESQAELIKYALFGGAVIFALWYAKKEITDIAPKVATALNPVDPNNLANKTVVGAYQAITGRDSTPGYDAASIVDYFTPEPSTYTATHIDNANQYIYELPPVL